MWPVSKEALYDAAGHLHAGQNNARAIKAIAWDLVCCLSRSDHADSTIAVMATLLRVSRTRPHVMDTPEARANREILKTLAREGNFQAMTLEGLLAVRARDSKSAISWFNKAMGGAVQYSRQPSTIRQMNSSAAWRLDEVMAPWLDLAMQYTEQGNYKKMQETYDIGKGVDDPTAYYLSAVVARHQQRTYSLPWFHDMSKAAATGHPRAAMELADFYADWSVELLPTLVSSKNSSNFVSEFLAAMFQRSIETPNATKDIEFYAAFTSTPLSRTEMAMDWLAISANYGIAAAYERKARVHISKWIYPVNNLSMRLAHPDRQTQLDHKTMQIYEDLPEGVDNPFFDLSEAHDCLSLVFEAYDSIARDAATKRTKDEAVAPTIWNYYPDIADMNAEAFSSNDQLLHSAMEIADTVRIDVYDQKEGLRYKYKR